MSELKGELLPCPFCGGKVVAGKIAESNVTYITHFLRGKCVAKFDFFIDEADYEKLLKAWNTRSKIIEAGEHSDNTAQLAIASMDKIADVLSKNHVHGQIYEVAKIVDEWRSATTSGA